MRFLSFEPDHLFQVEPQGPQAAYVKWMTPDIATAASAHFSFTGIDDRERVVGCAGLAPTEGGELVAWALFSPLLGSHILGVTRAVRMGLDLHKTKTVVAHIHPGHTKAAAFARALSFTFKEERADLHPSGAVLHVYTREGVNG